MNHYFQLVPSQPVMADFGCDVLGTGDEYNELIYVSHKQVEELCAVFGLSYNYKHLRGKLMLHVSTTRKSKKQVCFYQVYNNGDSTRYRTNDPRAAETRFSENFGMWFCYGGLTDMFVKKLGMKDVPKRVYVNFYLRKGKK